MSQTQSPLPVSQPESFQVGSSPADAKAMTFVQHLEELRHRVLVCVVSLMVTTAVSFVYANRMIALLQALAPKETMFVQLTPGEVFLSSFKLSMFVGLGLSLPVVLYQVFRFVSPGLEAKEKKYLFPLLFLSTGLFGAGVLFGYWVILPLMLNFLLDYGAEVAKNQMGIAAYLEFCTGFLFASGLVFQVPLVLLLTSLLGLMSSQKLMQQWKWVVITCFLLAALITPSPDPFSQCVMAASLFGLYGFSILLMKLFKR